MTSYSSSHSPSSSSPSSSSPSSSRDETLDLQKGISCLLMVIAHMPFVNLVPQVPLGIIAHMAGLLPPVIFFGIAGVTATIQVNRYTLRSMLVYFGALFLLGGAWNVVVHGDMQSFGTVEIFQLIALGSIGVCILERSGRAGQWQLLGAALAILLVKELVEWRWPHFDGWNYLFCDSDYQPHTGAKSGGEMILPGFPLFPWLSWFFLGVFAYRASRPLKLALALLSLVGTVVTTYAGSSPIEKWDTSLSYLFANCTVLFSYFWLFHGGGAVTSRIGKVLCRIGSNAFLFFFAHPLGTMLGFGLFWAYPNPYLAWAVALAIAVGFFLLLSRLKPGRRFHSPAAWWFLIVLIFVAPLLPQLIDSKAMVVIPRLIALVVGITAAVNFSALSALTRVKRGGPAAAISPEPSSQVANPLAD